jgi:hypothetical protein
MVEEDNPYLDLMRQEQTGALRSSMYGAAQTEPDVEAELRKLAQKVNVPVETVRATARRSSGRPSSARWTTTTS